jgi:tyrosine-specific transport protein
VLALPTATMQSGLLPSSVALLGVWAYMVATGLLIAEVNVNLICRSALSFCLLVVVKKWALSNCDLLYNIKCAKQCCH